MIEVIESPELRLEHRRELARAHRLEAVRLRWLWPGKRVMVAGTSKPCGVLEEVDDNGMCKVRLFFGRGCVSGVEADLLNSAHLTYEECEKRYPLLCRALRWTMTASHGEAACCVRDYRDGQTYGGECVSHSGLTCRERIARAATARLNRKNVAHWLECLKRDVDTRSGRGWDLITACAESHNLTLAPAV